MQTSPVLASDWCNELILIKEYILLTKTA